MKIKIIRILLQKIPTSFRSKIAKISSLKKEKENFKLSISQYYRQIFTAQKFQNRLYRAVFFCFGLLFLALGFAIFFKTINFSCGVYFKNCTLLKHCINLFSFALAGSALIVSYKINPEQDAIQYLADKVERELNYPARDLEIEFNAFISGADLDPILVKNHQSLPFQHVASQLHEQSILTEDKC